jgi:hypothetical protein
MRLDSIRGQLQLRPVSRGQIARSGSSQTKRLQLRLVEFGECLERLPRCANRVQLRLIELRKCGDRRWDVPAQSRIGACAILRIGRFARYRIVLDSDRDDSHRGECRVGLGCRGAASLKRYIDGHARPHGPLLKQRLLRNGWRRGGFSPIGT